VHELIALVVQIVAGIALPAAVVKWDERRLTPARLRRAWPVATFWCSVVTFGIFCLPIHFWRTRRSFLGFSLGLLWALAAAIVLGALGWVVG
jgi:hypothetical protein